MPVWFGGRRTEERLGELEREQAESKRRQDALERAQRALGSLVQRLVRRVEGQD